MMVTLPFLSPVAILVFELTYVTVPLVAAPARVKVCVFEMLPILDTAVVATVMTLLAFSIVKDTVCVPI